MNRLFLIIHFFALLTYYKQVIFPYNLASYKYCKQQ